MVFNKKLELVFVILSNLKGNMYLLLSLGSFKYNGVFDLRLMKFENVLKT